MTESTKKARDMDEAERAATLAAIKRGPPPPPVTLPEKHARDMSDAEKSEWLAEHRRKFR
jgi:hypothetical protein